MKRIVHLLPFLLMLFLSCAPEETVVVPDGDAYDLPAGAVPLTGGVRRALEGVYQVTDNVKPFGEFIVLRWSYVATGADTTHYLSMFAGREVSYFILEGGRKDSVLHFSGYWRKMTSFQTGNAAFTVTSPSGAAALLGAHGPVDQAGFAPPDFGKLTANDQLAGFVLDAVASALRITRPSSTGAFFPASSGPLHRNLTAAFPEAAQRAFSEGGLPC